MIRYESANVQEMMVGSSNVWSWNLRTNIFYVVALYDGWKFKTSAAI